MKIKFIKKYNIVPKGTVMTVSDFEANRLIALKIAISTNSLKEKKNTVKNKSEKAE